MKEVYDEVYEHIHGYGVECSHKIEFIGKAFEGFDRSARIIDVGCGQGHYIRKLKGLNFKNILGVDFSLVCSQNYLSDLEHVNADFLDYSKEIPDKEFEICLCMDVLEHIQILNLEIFLGNIYRISNVAFLGIANHSDIFLGEQLHVIQKGVEWWVKRLETYYNTVENLFETASNTFFILKCYD